MYVQLFLKLKKKLINLSSFLFLLDVIPSDITQRWVCQFRSVIVKYAVGTTKRET